MFNDLPDCILLHILSFLDTKRAVRTCILSTRWKDLWKHVPTLTLSCSNSYYVHWENLKCFSRFVSWILSKRDASTALHAVDFERRGLVDPNLLKRIVKYAVSHNVQRLQIHVKCEIQHFPSCFFSCYTLTSLDLYVGPRIYDQITLFPNSLKLPALTSLSLYQFAFPVDDNGRAKPFSTFNRLNSLFIDSCIVLDAQKLCISSATLANLTIQTKYRPVNFREIELSTPSLCTFAFNELFLNPMWMIPWLPPRDDPTVVSEPMVRRRIRPAPCIESLPDKGDQATRPVCSVATAVQV
ncbi:hypothetical protein TSUD_376600 [Trifolium subterraneum]|uniref:F-box domain-containing protein n=1 Tax=Trifolium subterraneum TaxID=3900 RepID=A0A2Z6PTM1_TRISU|nr:hypothetical protein TSUD_376600 [Trifolium subterraneum]